MKKLFILILISYSFTVTAQDSEFWADINLYKNLNKRLTLFGDAGPRITLHKNSTNIFYIRPSISFKASDHIVLNGGIAWFHTSSPDKRLDEFRGWQGVRFEWKVFNRILLNSFTRLEERWFFLDDGQRDFKLRFRTLAGITVPLNNSTLEAKTVYLPLAYEVFEDLNDHEHFFFNRARVYLGAGYVISSKTRVELFYIANESRKNPEDKFTVVDVARLRIHVTL